MSIMPASNTLVSRKTLTASGCVLPRRWRPDREGCGLRRAVWAGQQAATDLDEPRARSHPLEAHTSLIFRDFQLGTRREPRALPDCGRNNHASRVLVSLASVFRWWPLRPSM